MSKRCDSSGGIEAFCHQASHNVVVLLREAERVEARPAAAMRQETYRRRVKNGVYASIVRAVVERVRNPRGHHENTKAARKGR